MFRNLTMGLLLANLLVLAWARWILAPDAEDPRAFGDSNEPELVLIERTVRVGVTDGDTDSGSAEAGTSCFRLGPFVSVDSAAGVADRLSARGLPVGRTTESGQIWVGHWVQLLDMPSPEAAQQAVKKLVGVGIKDAYISSREPTIDISLGVFRGRQGADDVVRQARKAGYSVQTTDRFRDGIEHWVEVEAPSDQPPDLADLKQAYTKSGEAQIIRIEARSCAPAAVTASDGNGDGTEADDSLESPAPESGSTGSPAISTTPE